MKRWGINTFVVLFFGAALFKAQSYDAIINLGDDCQVAYQLYIHGLRHYALPFDTLVTPYVSLSALLENSFVGFLDPDNFELAVDERGEKYILDKRYGAHLLHDFALEEDFLNNYAAIAAKYLRRIERFTNLIITSECPLFIRKRISKDQAIELRDILSRLRQGRPFLLVVLDGTAEMETDWLLEGIKNYYLRQLQPYIWHGDSAAWEETFYQLGLPIADAQSSSDER